MIMANPWEFWSAYPTDSLKRALTKDASYTCIATALRAFLPVSSNFIIPNQLNFHQYTFVP
jgi:hypothetical protein